ncbi:MAG: alpha-amylase family protein [Dermatophilus congolensis]|nr:alpha-amylase family protein [Dermatophilus congolensis]
MMWVKNAIWWQVYPLGFVGAQIRGDEAGGPVKHRFAHLEAWLDHALELGASGIMLGPVFASESHGYDTIDHFRIDPRLGDLADFDHFVLEAKSRGLRVCLDGVFNHVGKQFSAYRRVLKGGPEAPESKWFHLTWPDGWKKGTEPEYRRFEGHGPLVELNHDSDVVADYVIDVMKFWLCRGVDAWRLDAAYAVDPAFWAKVLPKVREKYPKAWFVGEVIHGDYAGIVQSSTMDSLTQYELWKAIWSSLNDVNFHELKHALGRHQEFMASFVPQTFVGNHDVTRIVDAAGSPEKAILAATVLFTVAGIPSIYYGDEHGFTGVKTETESGDDAVRPTMPQSPSELAKTGSRVHDAYRGLIAMRRRHPWLVRSRVEVEQVTNERVVYRAIPDKGKAAGRAADQVLTVTLDLTDPQAPAASVIDVDGNEEFRI